MGNLVIKLKIKILYICKIIIFKFLIKKNNDELVLPLNQCLTNTKALKFSENYPTTLTRFLEVICQIIGLILRRFSWLLLKVLP